MSDHTKNRTVHFARAFSLPGMPGLQPAGVYTIHEERRLIEGVSWLATQRVSTAIELKSGSDGRISLVPVDFGDLEAALLADAAGEHP